MAKAEAPVKPADVPVEKVKVETVVTDGPNGLKVELGTDGEITDTTGSRRLEIRFGGTVYTHKRDDAAGRWVYRAD